MSQMDDVSGLKSLGAGSTKYENKLNPDLLETFPNRTPDSDYVVSLKAFEFTSLCPKTGQPDFARISIIYSPAESCIETKSLKLYLGSYRNQGMFMETIVNNILNDVWAKCPSKWMRVIGEFNSRGGISLLVEALREP